MKKLRVGIYDYYLDSFGGGEKDVCVMADALKGNFRVELLSFKDAPKSELEKRLSVDLSGVEVKTVLPFTGYDPFSRAMRYISSRLYWKRLTSRYDLFINLVNYAPHPSYAKRSVLRVQFPSDRLSSSQSLGTYAHVVANSEFTRRWTKKRWGVDAEVITPPVTAFRPGEKKDVLLSVGRFFAGGHNKKHLEMITAFRRLCDEGVKGWEYHIDGSTLPGTHNRRYLERVRAAAAGYPVFIHADAPFSLLVEHYAKAKVFVHATGMGEDEDEHPERFEHFGITTVEAMSAGCVPVVMDGGGQGEIVTHGRDGFLWKSEDELMTCLRKAMTCKGRELGALSGAAMARSRDFGLDVFRERTLAMAERVTRGL